MLHLRIIVPAEHADRVRAYVDSSQPVCSVIALGQVAVSPPGEVFLCDVPDDEADVIIGDLQDLVVPARGLIAVQQIDVEVGHSGHGGSGTIPGKHALAWENVEAQTSESADLSASYLIFMVLAMLIAAAGIAVNTTTLIVGAMIVGPDFGPVAGFCVAALERRARLAARSLAALAAGYAAGLAATVVVALLLRADGVLGPSLVESASRLTPDIAQVTGGPDFFSFFVAAAAGIAGMLSLSAPKSSALIGVLVSVTTIPAAANVALALIYSEWGTALGSAGQLGANVGTLFVTGTITLAIQRLVTTWRRARR
ncbi:MAG: DUF389 domain-containing protein [Trebonia sp.]